MHYSKYKAKKVEAPEGTFDSKKEYRRYKELVEMEKAGYISHLKRQIVFELLPKQELKEPRKGYTTTQHCELPVKYIADFAYMMDGKLIVEDTKGVKTPEYVIKRKLMLWIHGIQLKEV